MSERERAADRAERQSLVRNVSLLQTLVLVLAVGLLVVGGLAWSYRSQLDHQGKQITQLQQQTSDQQVEINQLK